jgi:RNA methyltransferase, TrmH family
MNKAKKHHFKEIRSLLKERSFRDKKGIFVAEGHKIVAEALTKDLGVVSVFISGRVVGSPAARDIIALCHRKKVEALRTPAAEFEKLSSLNNSQGVLALIKKPVKARSSAGNTHVLCDNIQDPGNLGTIIRTSAAFGASSVLIMGATADVYNPKVVRSSSGTVMEMPVVQADEEYLDKLKSEGFYVISASSARSKAKKMQSVEIPDGPVIIAFGNEGRGLSQCVAERSDDIFFIPMSEAAESLNVTAAAAIAIHHFASKRGSCG